MQEDIGQSKASGIISKLPDPNRHHDLRKPNFYSYPKRGSYFRGMTHKFANSEFHDIRSKWFGDNTITTTRDALAKIAGCNEHCISLASTHCAKQCYDIGSADKDIHIIKFIKLERPFPICQRSRFFVPSRQRLVLCDRVSGRGGYALGASSY